MNKGKMTVFAVMAAVLLTAAIFVVFLISTAAGSNSPPIELPPAPTGEGPGSGGSMTDPNVTTDPDSLIEINTGNVKQVIEYLDRPETYSMDITVERYWDGGSSSDKRKAWASGGFVRWQFFDKSGAPAENYITGHGKTYIWEEGSKEYFSSADAGITADDMGQIPTYEDILEADDKDIVSAAYEEFLSEPCVKAVIEDRINGYIRTLWVSIEDGLLWGAEVRKDGKLVYNMSVLSESFNTSDPEESLFRLPDGRNLLD
jgi:hypothetical protein